MVRQTFTRVRFFTGQRHENTRVIQTNDPGVLVSMNSNHIHARIIPPGAPQRNKVWREYFNRAVPPGMATPVATPAGQRLRLDVRIGIIGAISSVG